MIHDCQSDSRHGRKMRPQNGDDGKTESPFLSDFRSYAAELRARHDRHERLVRMSRDVTIESKRIIFFLHSVKCEDKTSNLNDARNRIGALANGPLKDVASELRIGSSLSIDTPRTVSIGIEELIEAYCLLQYLQNPNESKIPTWHDFQETVVASREGDDPPGPRLRINPLDFMLGVMDFTGELMRMCINNASSECSESCFTICRLMQEIYTGVLSVTYNKELYKKMSTLKQSLQKVEDTCYKLKIRNLQL